MFTVMLSPYDTIHVMKIGPDFTASPGALRMEEFFRKPDRAAAAMTRLILPRLTGIAPDELIREEPRVGFDGSVETIRKFATKDAQGDYVSSVTRLLEKLTLDESPQSEDDTIAVFGPRRLHPDDHERIYGSAELFEFGPELRDLHFALLAQTRSGRYSTFAFRLHAEEQLNVMTRMRDNIRDYRLDSYRHRLEMLGTGALKVARHELSGTRR